MRRRNRQAFAVIGLGRFGTALATSLMEQGHDVLGVDLDLARLEELKEVLTEVQAVDATHPRALAEIGVPEFDACVVGLGDDLGASISITLNLLDLGARRVVAKATTEQQARILQQLGAHEVVFPERDLGLRLAHTLGSPGVSGFFAVAPEAVVYTAAAPEVVWGRTLVELDLRRRWGITVLGYYRAEEFVTNPPADSSLAAGDRLVLFGAEPAIREFLGL